MVSFELNFQIFCFLCVFVFLELLKFLQTFLAFLTSPLIE